MLDRLHKGDLHNRGLRVVFQEEKIPSCILYNITLISHLRIKNLHNINTMDSVDRGHMVIAIRITKHNDRFKESTLNGNTYF